MSLTDEAQEVAEQHRVTNARKKRPKHPTGFEPGLDTEKGTITTFFDHPIAEDEYRDQFSGLLTEWGFDPAKFTIEDDRVEIRTWDGLSNVLGPYGGEIVKLWYYKARVIRKRPKANVNDLVKRIRARRALKNLRTFEVGHTFVVVNSDWQLGKQDGRGTDHIIESVKAAIPEIKRRYEALRAQGVKIDKLLIANLGDLVEGCVGFYPMQTFNVALSRREQTRLGRELLTEQILAWADDFAEVLVAAVPGNHGENRNDDGKSFTNLGDNDDVALVEGVAEAFDLAKVAGSTRYEHVKFAITKNELSITLDVSGTILGLSHGHAAGRRPQTGKNLAHTKEWDWWYGQMMGRQPISDADILLTGHFHYLSVICQGGRTAIQAPPLDDGSEWFVESNGLPSTAASLTLVVGGGTENNAPGWTDLYVIQPPQ